ncbi:MAG: sulfatase [Rhodopirellula sp.]|nr:sulfatase [Rhodopirellula sp.]
MLASRVFQNSLAGVLGVAVVFSVLPARLTAAENAASASRPNILFCMADDWSWPHAGAYGDPVVRTPAFDRLSREGVLFENAFVTAPSCTPCRNAVLTGQWHWRLEEGGNLWSTLHPRFPVYPLLLEEAGYFVGHWRKAWGPGDWNALGRERDPAGPVYKSFPAFLQARPKGTPFCFWLGSSDPHRPYQWQSGAQSGIDIGRIRLPADLPDDPVVRHDVADYFYEVQRFDRDVAAALKLLEESGELDNTIVVMTGDNGMPFPRHKCQLYDSGTHAPLAIHWKAAGKAGRRVTDFVSLADLAPTFLEVAGVAVPEAMTGRSLLGILRSASSGRVDPGRDHVLTGRERHGQTQEKPNPGGYPMRAIRNDDFLYIRNFEPDRWPGGCPDPDRAFNGRAYGDCDDSPTKSLVIEHRDDPQFRRFYQLAFEKRPAEELYDLRKDPDQLHNVAGQPEYAETQRRLADRLRKELEATADPRVLGDGVPFDTYPYRRPVR